jgi:hypothetical protein
LLRLLENAILLWFVSTCISGANHPNSIYHNLSIFIQAFPYTQFHGLPTSAIFGPHWHLLCLQRCLLSSVVVGQFGDLRAWERVKRRLWSQENAPNDMFVELEG